MDKPKSKLSFLAHERMGDQIVALGGLEDRHIKIISWFIKDILRFDQFRLEMKYLETPKRLIIHLHSDDGNELFIKLKDSQPIDKIKEYLQLPSWTVELAKKETK